MWTFHIIVTIFIAIFLTAHGNSSQVLKSLPALDEQALNYRLPNNSRPLHYDLHIETDIHKGSRLFIGLARIYVKIMETTDVITMHFSNSSKNIVSVNFYEYEGTRGRSVPYEFIAELDFIKIQLPTKIPLNDEIILEISYQALLTDMEPKGFYRTSYLDENFEQVWLLSTHLQPTSARLSFPCYDEPEIRSTFSLQIRHDKSYKAISNMPAINVTDHGSNYVVTVFETTPLMQSYLLAFVVSNFDAIENRDLNFPQRVFGAGEKIANGDGEFAIKIADELYHKIEEIFNFSLPLSKLDHAAIPGMTSALEGFGLITYDDNFLLLNRNFDERFLEFFRPQTIGLIAHEMVHQLIGNTVGIKWWQHLWMNEGLTMFLHHYIPSLLYPQYDFMQIFREQVLRLSFAMDHRDETVNKYPHSPDEILDKFNSISFEKSAAVIRMFFEALTPATFMKGLNYYLHEMQFKAAIPDDFHRALQRAYDEDNKEMRVDVGKMMEKWENLPGFPLLSASRDGNRIVVKQRRYKNGFEGFIDFPKVYDESINPIYSIPLTYAKASESSFDSKVRHWMTTESIIISDIQVNEWIIFNINQVGYYKVDYSRDLWIDIIDGYKKNSSSIPVANREVLHEEMFDAWLNLGTKSISDCLELLRVLEAEREGAVWQRAGEYIQKLNEFFLFSEFYDKFLALMHAQLNPHVDVLGDVDEESSKLSEQVTRWSKETKLESYLRLEHDKLVNYMSTSDENKKPDFCSAFILANTSVYNHFYDKVFNDGNFPSFELAGSLGCRRDPTKLKQLLSDMLNSTKISNEFIIMEVFTSTMKSSVLGLEAVMEVSYERTKDLKRISSLPSQNLAMLLSNLINSQRHFVMYKNLAKKFVDDSLMKEQDTAPLLTAIELKLQSPEWGETRKWFAEQEETTTTISSTSSSTLKPESTTEAFSTSSSFITSFRLIAICLSIKIIIM